MDRRLVVFSAAAALLACAPAAAGAAHRHAKPRLSPAEGVLARMAARGQLSAATARTDRWLLRDSRAWARRLGGSAGWALAGAADVADRLAARHQLGPVLVPVFDNVAATRRWFAVDRRPTPATGARTTFGSSPIIYSFRPDAGWQIHPLANWGAINGLLSAGRRHFAQMRAYADAMLDVAVVRGGALTWEYLFPYAGAGPGWVSAMPAATRLRPLQALYAATGDARYAEAIQGALDILSWAPPLGARLSLGAGHAAYLLYAQQPGYIVGNAFVQVLLGLNDYVAAAPDGPQRAQAQQLLADGLAEARTLLPDYDTGTWSWYAVDPQGRGLERSDLHYHDLFGYFLRRGCRRFGEPFCSEGNRFRGYPSLAPQLGALTVAVHRRVLAIAVPAAAEATGRLSLWRGSRTLRLVGVALHAGTNRLTLPRPSGSGQVRVKLEATAMDGSSPETAQATATLPPPRRRAGR